MAGAVVDDPEHPPGRAVGFVPHPLGDEPFERGDPGLGFAAAEHLGAVHVPGGEIGPGAPALVFVLDIHRPARARRQSRMAPAADLDAGLLVGAQHVVAGPQGQPLPAVLVQIQDPARLGGERGIAGEDPAPVAPRAQRILAEPPPEGGAADLGDESLRHHLASQLSQRPARQGNAPPRRQLTREGFDLDDDAGGKSGLGARPGAAPPVPAGVRCRTACATC